MKSLFISMVIAMVASLSFAANKRGGDGVGNGDPDLIAKRALQQLLENDGYYLKRSLLNYMDTLQVEEIQNLNATDKTAKEFFEKFGKDRIKDDIQNSRYSTGNCFEKQSPGVSAQTGYGQLHGRVCFDLQRFYGQNKNQTPEQRQILLASLAFHEHVHHFQSNNERDINTLEREAYAVSAYVLNTATFGSVPSLIWSPKGQKEYFQVVNCEVSQGPYLVGLVLPFKAMDILRQRGFKGIAQSASADGDDVYAKTSFSIEFADYEEGKAPTLMTKSWPMSEDSTIPVVIAAANEISSGRMALKDAQLINPKWQFLGSVQKMKFNGEWVPKRGRFSLQAKLVTYQSNLEEAAKQAIAKGSSVDDAVKAEAAKYTAGLIDTDLICDVEGFVN